MNTFLPRLSAPLTALEVNPSQTQADPPAAATPYASLSKTAGGAAGILFHQLTHVGKEWLDPSLVGGWKPQTISLSNHPRLETEGERNWVSIEVIRSNGHHPVSINVDVSDGSAHAGVDYVPFSGTIHFSADQTIQEIRIQLLTPQESWANKNFNVSLREESGVAIVRNSSVTVEIPDPTPVMTAEWTLMLYMAADNDLERYASFDIKEMMSALGTDSINVVVLLDTSDKYHSNIGLHDTRWGKLSPNSNQDDQILNLKSLGERDTGDPSTLKEFINNAVINYPAKKYGLIGWSHGDAINGVFKDDGSQSMMNIDGMRDAIQNSEIRKLDLIGFDACSMGMIEIINELKDVTQLVVASADPIPNNGWAYDEILSSLFANPGMSDIQLATNIVASYDRNHGSRSSLFAYSTKSIPQLLDALHTLLTTVENMTDVDRGALLDFSTQSHRYGSALERHYIDLNSLVKGIEFHTSNPLLASDARRVAEHLREGLIATTVTDPLNKGIGAFLPVGATDAQVEYYASVKLLWHVDAPLWSHFLEYF